MVTNLSSYGRLTAVPPAPSGQASPRLAIGPASAGTMTWTTPSGRTYTTCPSAYPE